MLRGLLLAVGLLVFSAGCTIAPYDLSALPKDFPPGTVIVSLDTWHAMMAFPVHSQDGTQHGEQEYEEWGYAERAWYVEGRTGLSGIFRALLWPTDGVVEVGRHPTIWAERTPQPPAEVFVLTLEPESYRHLRVFLESTRLSRTALASFGDSDFFPSVRSYHLFHTCHQYAAYALQAAGLPLTPALALTRTMLGWQLRRLPQPCRECGKMPPAAFPVFAGAASRRQVASWPASRTPPYAPFVQVAAAFPSRDSGQDWTSLFEHSLRGSPLFIIE